MSSDSFNLLMIGEDSFSHFNGNFIKKYRKILQNIHATFSRYLLGMSPRNMK